MIQVHRMTVVTVGDIASILKALVDKSFDQMKQTYEAERDKEFAAHACATFSRAVTPKK